MAITEQQIETALKETIDPTTGKDYITSKEVHNIKIDGNNVSLDIELGYPAKSVIESIRQQVNNTLKAIPVIGNVTVNVSSKIIPHSVQRGVKLIPGKLDFSTLDIETFYIQRFQEDTMLVFKRSNIFASGSSKSFSFCTPLS